jgi:N-acetylglucosamine-6-phosphate deacetylase
MMKHALIGARLFTGEKFLDDHALLIVDEIISAILPLNQLDESIPKVVLKGGILAPGFIDLQVNGGGGAFFTNSPDVNAIHTMVDAHRKTGTTSMLPTLISDTPEAHQAGVKAVSDAIHAGNKSVLGVHIEGPFFDLSRRGAHKESYIRKIEQADINWLIDSVTQQKHACKFMITLAPEHVSPEQIKQLASAGVLVCAGHTNAQYEQVVTALENGLSGFTHLFNAMSPLTSREPGVVGAALNDANSWCGIIVDTHHVHDAAIRIACAAKPKGKIYLVTDAMSTVGSPQKSFEIYGENIIEKNGCLVNGEGRLAGSAIGMIDAVRLTNIWVGLDLDESLRMASLYPAEFMQVHHYLGKIQPGYRADLVHFTEDFRVTHTWVAGEMSQHMSAD